MQAISVWLFQVALESADATDLVSRTKLFAGTSDARATPDGRAVADGDISVGSVAADDVDEEDAIEGSAAEAGGPSNA